jgi:pilus assembly protein CpaC
VPGRETRSPDDYEFYLENLLEAPRGQRQVWNGHCYNAAYKCDTSANKYPCVGNVCGANNLLNGGGTCATGGCGATRVATPGAQAAVPAALPPMPVTAQTTPDAPATETATTPAIEPPLLTPVPAIEGPKK